MVVSFGLTRGRTLRQLLALLAALARNWYGWACFYSGNDKGFAPKTSHSLNARCHDLSSRSAVEVFRISWKQFMASRLKS
jgi:hypothetical protein